MSQQDAVVEHIANELLREGRGAGADSSRANSRAALIDAALEEFSTKGYEATTVASIAERAGVTTGALYAHFAGKLDLLIATVGLTPVEDVVRSVDEIAALSPDEAVHRLGEGLAAQPDRRTLLLLDVIVAARRNPRMAAVLRDGLMAYIDATARVTESGAARGLVAPTVNAEDLSRLFGLLNLGMIVFAALDAPAPSEAAFERLVELLLSSAAPAGDDPGVVERPPNDESAALARVRARALAAARAQRDLHEAVADAVDAGHSLRQVGSAAGMSHERVRQVLRQDS
jgi:AcrR family transcriptional regulator